MRSNVINMSQATRDLIKKGGRKVNNSSLNSTDSYNQLSKKKAKQIF